MNEDLPDQEGTAAAEDPTAEAAGPDMPPADPEPQAGDESPNTPADPPEAQLSEELHGDPVVDPVGDARAAAAATRPKPGVLNPKDDPGIGTMTYGKGMPHERRE